MRVGIGYDIHPLKAGFKYVLAGVPIPHKKGFSGHSDGDVLFHAVVDALLGAAGLGDIGDYFSDKDARWKNANSVIFIKKTVEILKKKKFKIQNVDVVIIAQEPRISPYKNQIRRSLASALTIKESDVNVKAKTNEKMDSVGRGLAVAVMAVASLKSFKG